MQDKETQRSREEIEIEVVYAAGANSYQIMPLRVLEGTCVEEAIIQSGILLRFPEICLRQSDKSLVNPVGIFGRITELNTPVQEGDRVEIYRNLKQSPIDLRKAIAAQKPSS